MPIAQLNVARMLGPIDSEIMRPFVEMLDAVNAVAEASPGFLWRNRTPAGDASLAIAGDPWLIINLSVWASADDLWSFVYQGLHREIFLKRKAMFESMPEAHYVLWQVEPGAEPSISEALARLEFLRANGDTDYAFRFGFLNRKP